MRELFLTKAPYDFDYKMFTNIGYAETLIKAFYLGKTSFYITNNIYYNSIFIILGHKKSSRRFDYQILKHLIKTEKIRFLNDASNMEHKFVLDEHDDDNNSIALDDEEEDEDQIWRDDIKRFMNSSIKPLNTIQMIKLNLILTIALGDLHITEEYISKFFFVILNY